MSQFFWLNERKEKKKLTGFPHPHIRCGWRNLPTAMYSDSGEISLCIDCSSDRVEIF